MTVLDEKLEPCPFCGGKATSWPEAHSDENPNEVIAPSVTKCDDCGAMIYGDWQDESVAAWNGRALASLPSTGVKVTPINDLARKSSLFIDNAAIAAQNDFDEVTREAIELNIIAPLILEISERDQMISCITPSVDPAGTVVEQSAADVLAERQRQVESEGWTPEHDDGHSNGELAAAASCYAYPNASVRKLVPSRWDNGRSLDDDDIPVGRTDVPANWPDWDGDWWKPGDRRRNLVKAGALILAEIERLDRAALASIAPQGGEGAE